MGSLRISKQWVFTFLTKPCILTDRPFTGVESGPCRPAILRCIRHAVVPMRSGIFLCQGVQVLASYVLHTATGAIKW